MNSGSPPTPAAAQPVRVVLADGQNLFRTSLRHLLSLPAWIINDVYGVEIGAGFQVIGEAQSGEETISVVRSVKPDLLLLDVAMPSLSGLAVLDAIATSGDGVPTVLMTETISTPDLLTAIHLGVGGLIFKGSPTERLFEAILCVTKGKCWLEDTLVTDLVQTVRPLIRLSRAAGGSLGFRLTARERGVLKLVAAGHRNKEIAQRCAVSEETVKHHITHIFDKVGVSNRAQLVTVVSQCGLSASV